MSTPTEWEKCGSFSSAFEFRFECTQGTSQPLLIYLSATPCHMNEKEKSAKNQNCLNLERNLTS